MILFTLFSSGGFDQRTRMEGGKDNPRKEDTSAPTSPRPATGQKDFLSVFPTDITIDLAPSLYFEQAITHSIPASRLLHQRHLQRHQRIIISSESCILFLSHDISLLLRRTNTAIRTIYFVFDTPHIHCQAILTNKNLDELMTTRKRERQMGRSGRRGEW
jgi:hypothetical protein